ncbi:MAG: aspartate 1-decarboxylase [Chloroflexi bacterium]|nr:aspartate 1-decarboxylase [Chloroflexota bacterium]
MRVMLKSKIHRATVTDCNINYEGSITIDRKLLKEADILPYEQVHIADVNNGNRLITYAIEGENGEICINGAAARLVNKGDIVIILTYSNFEEDELKNYHPRLVYVDSQNKITARKGAIEKIRREG